MTAPNVSVDWTLDGVVLTATIGATRIELPLDAVGADLLAIAIERCLAARAGYVASKLPAGVKS